MQILKESTYRVLEARRLDIQVEIIVRDTFVVQKHYSLMLILINLVNNAIEAIERKSGKGCIVVSVERKGDLYVFTVADDGTGISQRDMNRIFQMGFSTKFDEATGNIYRGVGLSGVEMTVKEKFHGFIYVESEHGVGTEFRVEIPVGMLEATVE